jgi:hypothetical protein
MLVLEIVLCSGVSSMPDGHGVETSVISLVIREKVFVLVLC